MSITFAIMQGSAGYELTLRDGWDQLAASAASMSLARLAGLSVGA